MDSAVQTYATSHCAEEGYAGRIDVVTGPSGRRRWPEHVKAQIVLESYRDGVSVSDVARRHEVSAPQLHSWRRAARDGLLPMPEDDELGLVLVFVAGGSGEEEPPEDKSDSREHVTLDTCVSVSCTFRLQSFVAQGPFPAEVESSRFCRSADEPKPFQQSRAGPADTARWHGRG